MGLLIWAFWLVLWVVVGGWDVYGSIDGWVFGWLEWAMVRTGFVGYCGWLASFGLLLFSFSFFSFFNMCIWVVNGVSGWWWVSFCWSGGGLGGWWWFGFVRFLKFLHSIETYIFFFFCIFRIQTKYYKMKIFSIKYFACKIFYLCKYFTSKQTEHKSINTLTIMKSNDLKILFFIIVQVTCYNLRIINKCMLW